ncbi:MAG: Ig-like domain-containing protein [Terriglobales bacterium]
MKPSSAKVLSAKSSSVFAGIIACLLLVSLAGTAAAQTWTPLNNQPPVSVGAMLLLTDGRVLVHEEPNCSGSGCVSSTNAYNNWYTLTPDSTGSYINGTWTQVASTPTSPTNYAPLFFSSAVLPDGKVAIQGGEYNCPSASCADAWQSNGALYDPVANTWTALTPEITSSYEADGDAQSVVLPNGTWMTAACCAYYSGHASYPEYYYFNEGSLNFTNEASASDGETTEFDESGWNLMPNGEVLMVNVYLGQYSATAKGYAIYNPSTNTWTEYSSTAVQLWDSNAGTGSSCKSSSSKASYELGPLMLMPNGTYFATGASNCEAGNLATYNWSTNTWTAQGTFPGKGAANDAPGATEINGNAIVMSSPYTSTFSTPSTFYEWNGTTLSTFPNPANAANDASYVGHLLVLPTGQIMFTDFTTGVEILTSAGTYESAWQPTITTAPYTLTPGTTYSISGTQFNGVSTGAAYGDDFQDNTNYPLVRIVNNATGNVYYARTHGHSTMGVATGSTTVSTNFDVPSNMPTGPCELYVVGNGIPSAGSACNVGATLLSTTTSLSSNDNPSTYGQAVTFTATVTGSSGTPTGTVQFTDNSNVICSAVTLSSGTAQCNTSGLPVGSSQSIVATYSGSSTYSGSTGSLSQVVNQASQAITFTTNAPSSAAYNSQFTVAATASSGLAVAFTSSGSCSNSGATYTITSGAGTCSVIANQAGNTDYSAAPTVTQSASATPASQTISFTSAPPGSAAYNSQFTVAATATSGLAVVYTSAGGCTNSGPTYTMTSGTTACSVIVNQSGNTNYSAAPQLSQSVSTAKLGQTITFTTSAPSSAEYGSIFTVAATGGGSGNSVTFTSAGACTNSGATYTMTAGSGNCSVIADQAGNTNYSAAPEVTQTTAATNSNGSVSVSSNQNPSTYGQPVTFTATITSDTGAVKGRKGAAGKKPLNVTGSVTWSANTGCSASSVTGSYPGTATCTTSSLPVGASETVTATYSGDANHNGGAGSVSQQVNEVSSSVSVGSSLNPSSYGQAVNFTATVTGSSPTGTVQFSIDGNLFDTETLSAGSATSVSISSLAAGTHTVTATYSGDTNNAGSTGSLSGGQVVDAASADVSVASSQNPSTYQQSVTFTATISGENGLVKGRKPSKNGIKPMDPTGTVTWSSNTGCSASTVSGNPGTASCTTTSLPVGTDTITATYSGDSNHAGGTGSLSGGQVVNSSTESTTTSVSSSLNPSGYGQAVSFTANVSASSGTPTGTVQFSIDGNAFGSPVTLASGMASSGSISTLAAGTHTVTASYTPGTGFLASTGTLSGGQVVSSAGANVSVGSSQNPSTYQQSVTFTATISGANGLVKGRKPADVSGTVVWSSNTGCGTTSVVSGNPGTATCTTSSLQGGNDAITATYSGDSNHGGSTGSVSQQVNPASQTISCSAPPANEAYDGTFTISCTASSGLPVSYSSSGSCSNSGATYTITSGTGTCIATATQAGNNDWSPAPPVNQPVTAVPASQTINVSTPAPSGAVKGSSFTVAASATSGLAVSFGSSGACTNSGATYTMASTASGTCTEIMTQAGNGNYAAAPTVTETTTIAAAQTPTVSFTGAPASAVYGSSFTVSATTNASTTAVITAAPATVCTVSGNTVTMIDGMGTCTLTAKWAADDVYKAATATQKTTAAKADSGLAWATPAAITYGTALTATQLNATANVAGKFVYTPASGKVLTAGTQTLSVTFAPTASSDYAAATTTVQLQVNEAATTTTITASSLNPSTIGKAVKFSFTVAPGKPTGSVTVNASTGESCTGTLATGKGSCSITFSTSGARTMTATYGGDANNEGSASAGFTQTVN